MPITPDIEEITITYSYVEDGQNKSASAMIRKSTWLPTVESPAVNGARMRIEVLDVDGLPTTIILWEKQKNNLQNEVLCMDRPIAVASISDLTVYAVGVVLANTDRPPFFRESFFDSYFSSPYDLILTWRNVKTAIYSLLETSVELGITI